jgi:hypothetical protein
MNKTKNTSAKYRLPMFFLLSYLLSWWSAPLTDGVIIPYGPIFATLIVLAVTAGRQGIRKWWRRITHWRVAWYWYLVGPAIIVGYQGAAFIINLLLRASIADFPTLPSMGVFLQLLIIGGLWEEPGWSGYALPQLLDRYTNRRNGALIAVVILGVFRAIWHLPLFLYGHIAWFDIFIFEIGFQIIIGWLYIRSGGSVPVVMLFHFTSNLLGTVMSPVFTGAARTNYYALFMGLAAMIAVVITIFAVTESRPQSLPAQDQGVESGG